MSYRSNGVRTLVLVATSVPNVPFVCILRHLRQFNLPRPIRPNCALDGLGFDGENILANALGFARIASAGVSWEFGHDGIGCGLVADVGGLQPLLDVEAGVGPYDTFEDYCKDVEGLAYRTAQVKIQAYLVHKAIEDSLGSTFVRPSLEVQVRQFFEHDGAIAKFKTEKRVVTRLASLSVSHFSNSLTSDSFQS